MVKLSEIGELELIKRLERIAPSAGPGVVKGLGDDCAVIEVGQEILLMTTDQMVEGVHFRSERTDPAKLARKLLAVNLSDIAAMGGWARWGLLAAALDGRTDLSFWETFTQTLVDQCSARDISLVGGDTSSSPGPAFFNLTLIGRADVGEVIYRSGAGPGDLVYVSRFLGDAAAGLVLLENQDLDLNPADRAYLLDCHETPLAEEELGPLLGASGLITAMIDLSDGLAADLGRLADAGGLGAEVDLETLPISPQAQALAGRLGMEAEAWALGGGEDYALLFTVPSSKAEELEGLVRRRLGREVRRVGRMQARSGLLGRKKGKTAPLNIRGYEHFRP